MRRRRALVIFWVLMIVSAASAILLPAPAGVQATAALLFTPVSHPAQRVMGFVDDLTSSAPIDRESPARPRPAEDVYAENQRLRQALETLATQLDALKALNADRDRLGASLRQLSVPARVVGTSGGVGEVALAVVAVGEIAEGMPAVHYGGTVGGIAGKVVAVGPGGAQVRLITDRTFGAVARFVRIDAGAQGVTLLDVPPVFLEGNGDGTCLIRRVREADIRESRIEPGTLLVLADEDWPEVTHGRRLGRVTGVEAVAEEPGFFRVIVEPEVNLSRLREVFIVNRW